MISPNGSPEGVETCEAMLSLQSLARLWIRVVELVGVVCDKFPGPSDLLYKVGRVVSCTVTIQLLDGERSRKQGLKYWSQESM